MTVVEEADGRRGRKLVVVMVVKEIGDMSIQIVYTDKKS